MKLSELPKGWIFTDIEGVRDIDEMSTYNYFQYEKLPPITISLDDDFAWLEQELSYGNETRSFVEKIHSFQAQVADLGLTLPQGFLHFMQDSDLHKKIQSNTACYFEMGDFIEEINGLYLIQFLSDSQYCSLWYLCLDKEGNHAVICSPNVYGQKNYKEKFTEEIGLYVAGSFNEFIYRFWIENEIWFKVVYDEVELPPLTPEQLAYCLHYNPDFK